MVQLTDEQVLAAAADDRLINVVSAPGSGKTTIAAERYGFLRYMQGDHRGVLGLTFNRAAATELRMRIQLRWGYNCVRPPHNVMTFDHLHAELFRRLLEEGKIHWPADIEELDIRDDYRGMKGYRFLSMSEGKPTYERFASLDTNYLVVSESQSVTNPRMGIGSAADHRAVLSSGLVSHADIRSILRKAMEYEDLTHFIATWLEDNYRAIVIDEAYDANGLDLSVAHIAAELGLSVTLIGDPWQALYKWRGAEPQLVFELLRDGTTVPFVDYQQTRSFRFQGAQMPSLTTDLRNGKGVSLPTISSHEIDVALARNWDGLWTVGDNILPLAFRSVNNATDAALNLLLDVVTRSRLRTESFGREGAIAKLGIDREAFLARQEELLNPLVTDLRDGRDVDEVLDKLREAVKSLGVRRPSQLKGENEKRAARDLAKLAIRLNQDILIPGLTVFQAKGREWDRVGVVLSRSQAKDLSTGLRKLEEEHCIIYVAITRARQLCGLLQDIDDDNLR